MQVTNAEIVVKRQYSPEMKKRRLSTTEESELIPIPIRASLPPNFTSSPINASPPPKLTYSPIDRSPPLIPKDFNALYPDTINDLLTKFSQSCCSDFEPTESDELCSTFKNFFTHAVFGGKMTRGKLGLSLYVALCPDADEFNLRSTLPVILSIELLQAVFLVIDDIMDDGEVRRGKPCWHRLPGIGLTALNHSMRLQNFVNIIVLDSIPSHPRLLDIFRLLWETIRVTSDGQELDGISASQADSLSFDRYRQIVATKTSRYTFYYPIALSIYLANIPEPESILAYALELSKVLGYYFQVQDDHLDFTADSASGKSSTDIKEGKCTWFACKTIENLVATKSVDKLERFKEIYGSDDVSQIEEAKQIMLDTGVLDDYKTFQLECVNDIRRKLNDCPLNELKTVLKGVLESLFDRKR